MWAKPRTPNIEQGAGEEGGGQESDNQTSGAMEGFLG